MLRLLSGVQGVPDTVTVACDTITVGRNGGKGVSAHVCLQHPKCPGLLSRQHVSIRLGTNGHLLVKDMGSMNGTFVCDGPGQPARRIAAREDVSLCPGSILYFGAKEQVFGRDGVAFPNPFVYQFVGRPMALLNFEDQTHHHFAAASPQPHSAAGQAPQQQPEHAKQQSQQQEPQPPQMSVQSQSQRPSHALDAPAAKRQKLSTATAAALLQQGACKLQQAPHQQVMPEPPAAAEHGPSGGSISVEIVEEAAAPAGHRHPHQLSQQQGLVGEPGAVAGSEPEVVQQLRQPLQEAVTPAQQTDQEQPPLHQQQQQQQPQSHVHESAAASSQQELLGHGPQPLAELDLNIPLHPQQQQTPVSGKISGATATGKAAPAAKQPSLSPSMRVSASALECAICREVMVAPHTLCCGHTFCGPCLQLWLERPKPTCPSCRTAVTQAPVLQLILNSLVSEAGLDQGSEGHDRAARLEAWNAVKDVTLAQWNRRFNSNSRDNKQAKQGNHAPRQQDTVAAADRPVTRQQRQQTRQAPAGVVSLLPDRPSRVAPAAGPANGGPAHQTASRGLTHAAVAAAVAAARASQAAATAVVNRAAGRSGSRRRSGRSRGNTNSAASVAAAGSTRAGTHSLAINAVVQQRRARSPARQGQLQWPQQQQTLPRVARQAPIDGFLSRRVPIAQ